MSNDFAQLDRIADRLIQNVPFFRGLNKSDLFGLLGKAGRQSYTAGETILREGEEAVDTLYIIVAGKVAILKTLGDGTTESVDSLGVGHCFGEMSLIDNQPRSASVVARDATVCLTCSAEMIAAFQALSIRLYENLAGIIAARYLDMEKQNRLQLKAICIDTCVKEITRGMPTLSSEMSARALAKLSDIGDPHHVSANSYVVKANSHGRYMYLVLDGELQVRKGADKDVVVLATLRRGSYFGETALVCQDHGRMADVYAVEDTHLVRLSSEILYKSPEIGALVYRELARIFSMRLRQATHIYMHTSGRNCQRDCEIINA